VFAQGQKDQTAAAVVGKERLQEKTAL